MKRSILTGTFSAIAVLLSVSTVQAATVELEWQQPELWRDIRAVDSSQQRYLERIMDELGEECRAEAEKLPADQNLHIAVRDVDLAGEIEYFYRNYPFGLRVIRNVDTPRLELSYELRDADNNVLQAGEDELRDPGFHFITMAIYDRNPFRYERALISDWYRQEF